MNKVNELHKLAMDIAEKAYIAHHKGDLDEAKQFALEAFQAEQEAAMLVKEHYDLEPTRSVLFRSAASLALDCGKIRDSERLISLALAGNPPQEIAEELRDLMEKVFFDRHLSLRGLMLNINEFQLSISGETVGFGIAPSEEFISRVKDIETLVYRTAERKLNKRYRDRGRRSKDLGEKLDVYVSIPRAASFAISFRLGNQMEFSGMSLPEDVINEMFDCFNLFNKSNFEGLKEHIEDDSYYNNFTALARKIAPDGKKIKTVGFTSLRKGKENIAVLSTPRNELQSPMICTVEEPVIQLPQKQERVEIIGQLCLADARKEDGLIDIKDEHGEEFSIKVPPGMMNDIVRPYFGTRVKVVGLKIDSLIHLENIDPAMDVEE